jgi:hypothetical protein
MRCKCGRTTNFGLTCASCSSSNDALEVEEYDILELLDESEKQLHEERLENDRDYRESFRPRS